MGRRFCWGWHLIAWDDEWRDKVVSSERIVWAMDRLLALLVEYEVDVTSCVYTGWVAPEQEIS